MSFEIKNTDFTIINGTNNWQPRPAMKAAMESLCGFFSDAYPSTETGDTWLSFDNAIGRTTIFATPIDFKTPDGYHLLDRLVIKTQLPGDAWQMSDALIVQANTLATTGALMTDPDTKELVIVSSATLLDGDDDSLQRLYVPLAASAAIFHPYSLISMGSLRDSGTGAPYEFEMSNDPSRWGQVDFESAETALRQGGVFSNAGSTGLAAEFPWEDGGVSWVSGDQTSLLTFKSDMRHPHLGNGLFFKLELPDAWFEEELVKLVHYLNLLEVTGADVPPFFGAWCSQIKTGRIAYVGFLPNLACWPGSVTHISGWLRIRARTARATIGNLMARGDQSCQVGQSIMSSVK